MKRSARQRLFWFLLALGAPIVFLWSWKAGAVPVTWGEVIAAATGGATGEHGVILVQLRLPRLIAAALTGAALSTAGAVFQALLRNPLAEPYVLGISGGAGAGAMLAAYLGVGAAILGIPTTPVAAFIGAALAVAFIHAFSLARGGMPAASLLLAGVALQALMTAAIIFLQSLMDPNEFMQAYSWLMGRIPAPDPATLVALIALVTAGFLLLAPILRSLNVVGLGDTEALAVGVDAARTRRIALVAASLLTGSVVAVSGLVGFVGIIVPHTVRLMIGPDHRRLVPGCAFGGALFLVVADTLARTLTPPVELPVGVLTALAGAPFFILLIRRRTEMGS